jgi:hypothetical protein
MSKSYVTTAEWDAYNGWVHHVWHVWAPANVDKLPRRIRMSTLLCVLWGITESGRAGLDCGIGDSRIAKIAGMDRNTVWEYRRFARGAGLLQYAVSGRHFGRVRAMDFVPVDAGLLQTATATSAGLLQTSSAVMLDGSSTNNTLNEQPSNEQHLIAMSPVGDDDSRSSTTWNTSLRGKSEALKTRARVPQSEWDRLGFKSQDDPDYAAWLLAKQETATVAAAPSEPQRYRPAGWED